MPTLALKTLERYLYKTSSLAWKSHDYRQQNAANWQHALSLRFGLYMGEGIGADARGGNALPQIAYNRQQLAAGCAWELSPRSNAAG